MKTPPPSPSNDPEPRDPLATMGQRLRDLLDLAPVAMWIAESERVSFANHAAYELFGLQTGTDLVGRSLFTLLDQDCHAAVRSHIAQALAGPPRAPLVHGHVLRPDGSQREVEIASVALPDHGQTMVQMVITDITPRQRELREARRHRAELRQLSASVVEAREEERRRIARELHDELGQRLTALKMGLSSLRAGGVRPAEIPRVDDMIEALDGTVAAVRRIAADLRPLMLDDLGLNAAVAALARDAGQRMGLKVDLQLEDHDPPLDNGAAIAVYRMVQEALTNVGRHARARRVRVSLLRDGGDIVLTVHDDGVGLPALAPAADGRYGLLGIRERALMLGGQLQVDNPAGGGGRVCVRLPLQGNTTRREPGA
jgi:two-component system sensor histidine kinase UhpB